MDRSVPRVLPCPKSRGAVADSRALAGLFLFPRRWGRQPSGPEPYHLLCTFRQHGRRLALCFCGRSATSRPHYSIGSAQPHTHQRVFLDPGISHVLWRVKTTLGKQRVKHRRPALRKPKIIYISPTCIFYIGGEGGIRTHDTLPYT